MFLEHDLNSFFDKLNNELTTINNLLKTEKDMKKIKLLSNQSETINTALNKLALIKSNNILINSNNK